MFKQLSIAAASLFLCAGLAQAASHAAAAPAAAASAKPTAQQSKMGDCNKSAGEKKGDERKAFMKTCLSGKPDPQAACEKTADEKKLHGAAKASSVKKCVADAK